MVINMIIIRNNSTDPYFNLASEEYLLDNVSGDIFMLWRNEPAVIIGRNQNAFSEINDAFVKEHNIKVVRRLTGGGAVFHDLGNVNFTCITSHEGCEALDFARFTLPVIEALNNIGVPASLSGRNDITAEGKKISGNAQCIHNNKVMHHGTLLFSADMSRLVGALNVDPEKISSKGIKSIRARVGNISEYVKDMTVRVFIDYLENFFEGEHREFSDAEKAAIQKLADEKYSTWEWNYGNSKLYSAKKKKYYSFGLIEVSVSVDGGIITDIRFEGDYFGSRSISELEKKLTGLRFEYNELISALGDSEKYIMGAKAEEIAALILS